MTQEICIRCGESNESSLTQIGRLVAEICTFSFWGRCVQIGLLKSLNFNIKSGKNRSEAGKVCKCSEGWCPPE